MKLTNKKLKQIIKEELEAVLSENYQETYMFVFDKKGVRFQDRQGIPRRKYFPSYSEEYDIIAGAAMRNPEAEDRLVSLIEKLRPKNPTPTADNFEFSNRELIKR